MRIYRTSKKDNPDDKTFIEGIPRRPGVNSASKLCSYPEFMGTTHTLIRELGDLDKRACYKSILTEGYLKDDATNRNKIGNPRTTIYPFVNICVTHEGYTINSLSSADLTELRYNHSRSHTKIKKGQMAFFEEFLAVKS